VPLALIVSVPRFSVRAMSSLRLDFGVTVLVVAPLSGAWVAGLSADPAASLAFAAARLAFALAVGAFVAAGLALYQAPTGSAARAFATSWLHGFVVRGKLRRPTLWVGTG
jgi:hypothetical protein